MTNIYSYKAVVFDLDGVITKTALVHAASWKIMFDVFLKEYSQENNTSFKEFTHKEDYLPYVDGKPRYQGVESFLLSRDVHIPFGQSNDDPAEKTVCGLGNRKNIVFREVLEKDGIEAYLSTVELIKALKKNNVHIGVASSSKNCEYVLKKAQLEHFFETRVDGVVSVELGLQGKPNADIFVRAAADMGVEPKDAIVVEDAVSGVQAGANGKFGLVIGLARENNKEELEAAGADNVIEDFEGINLDKIEEWFQSKNSNKI